MEALLPAFIAVLLAELDGRVQEQSEALARHYGRPGLTLTALVLTTIASLTVAAVGGWLVHSFMNWNARSLLAGIALASSGAVMLWPRKPVEPVTGTRAFPTSLWRYAVNQFGDNSQFIVFAFAAWSRSPVLAAGAGLAAVLVAALPPLFFSQDWRALAPWKRLRQAGAVLLMIAGVWMGASAVF
jgi:putative Ca2+/H+ antiporter (TMEM165/GDT1 family)